MSDKCSFKQMVTEQLDKWSLFHLWVPLLLFTVLTQINVSFFLSALITCTISFMWELMDDAWRYESYLFPPFVESIFGRWAFDKRGFSIVDYWLAFVPLTLMLAGHWVFTSPFTIFVELIWWLVFSLLSNFFGIRLYREGDWEYNCFGD